MTDIQLRAVTDADLDVFFEFEREPDGRHMAGFTAEDPDDRDAFDAHWARVRSDADVTLRTIKADGAVAGFVAGFVRDGKPEVTYWIGQRYWGRGVATAALKAFLKELTVRPIYARAAADNVASRRVLSKCGFDEVALERGYAHARQAEIEEVVMELQ